MEPTFHIGDHLVFEYHRSPRSDRQIVLAADFRLGGEYAVKRLRITSDSWIFESENPKYRPVQISKDETPFPILGTFVGKLELP
jgi:SOS-response transcriptional repressor LexA